MTLDPALQSVIRRHIEIEPASGCWLWTGALNGTGYGQLTFRGEHLTAHRASFLAFKGPIPEGRLVCHHCDVRRCANPEHVYAGTHIDNRRDTLERSDWVHPFSQRPACSRGHPYVDGSYRVAADGSRVCRPCMREHMKRYRERKAA